VSTKISSRDRRTVAEHIRDRKPFETGGALKAQTYENGLRYHTGGALNGQDYTEWVKDRAHVQYVVWSYDTPIAWWSKHTCMWHVVEQKFSATTSKHQGTLYLIPENRVA